MMGLEGRLKKLMVLGSLSTGCQQSQDTDAQENDSEDSVETGDTYISSPDDTSDTSESADDTGDTYQGNQNHAPEMSTTALPSAITQTAYSTIISTSDPDGDSLTYSLSSEPTWLSIDALTGVLSGTPSSRGTETVSIAVSDGELSTTQNYSLVVDPLATVLITVRTPDDKEVIDTAYVSLDCEDGEYTDGFVETDGTFTADLDASTECIVYADDGLSTLEHAIYTWDHSFTSGSEDEASSNYYEVWAEIYDEFTPSDTEPEYATCYGGKLDTSRDLLLYANSMFDTVDGTDSGRRDFKRFFENEITSPIQYWISETDNDGNAMSSTMLDAMYSAISDAANTINTTNPSGTTYLQEATDINDAQIVFYYDDRVTSHSCYYKSSTNLVEDYGSGYYCTITLHMDYDSSRTVMAELFGPLAFISIDGCDDSITDGGLSPTKNDWFVLETTQRAKYQNLMERTY